MLKNYIKIAFRNLYKHKVDSVISIGGLALGIACCILLVLYVRFEWSYDTFHEHSEQIYRIVEETTHPRTGQVNKNASTPYVMASALKSTFPELEQVVRMDRMPVQIEIDNKFRSDEILLADPGFFSMFSFPLILGDAEMALSDPGNIVLTEPKAQQLFGRPDVIGETIIIRIKDEEKTFKVAGIAEAPPGNSSIKFEMVLPIESFPYNVQSGTRAWYSGFGETWLLLNKEASAKQLEEKFPSFVTTNYGSTAETLSQKLWLQPMDKVYFDQEVVQTAVIEQGNVLYSLVLAGIALVVLAIASINFMSLTLSRASGRSNEIGIRKVVGARRGQLGQQFLGEVFITCGFAFLLGIVLAELFVPFFQQIVQKPVTLGLFQDPLLWLVLGGLLLFTTLLTGSYPAFVISGRKGPGVFTSRRSAERIPGFVKGLIVVQFAMAITFLAAAFIMHQQLRYLFSRDLGFSPEHVIAVEVGSMDPHRGEEIYNRYGQEARRLAGVEYVSGSSSRFGYSSFTSGTRLDGFGGSINVEVADEHFLETMGIELIEGRNFSPERQSDINEGIIVNTSFVKVMGWEEPVGQVPSEDNNINGFFHNNHKRVIGVIGDYHYRPLYYNLEPLVFIHRDVEEDNGVSTMLIRIKDGMISQTLNHLSELWDDMFPNETFVYFFVDDRVRRQYEQEQRWSRIMKAASTTAILLACFGLFGLASLAAQRRTKEIGIRKVLGATIANIVSLLSKDFLKLVILGFAIAVPIAWYAMNRWLANFAYKIEIGAGTFALAGGAAVLIALATVSWQSVRAALANPVESLRSE